MPLNAPLLDQARLGPGARGRRADGVARARGLSHRDPSAASRRRAASRDRRSAVIDHQRVQQVVSAAGGSWWQVWRRRPARPDAVCTWCDRPPSEVSKLIAGPKVYICDACVESAERAREAAATTRHRCSFCRKRATESNPVVTGRANICSECLAVCREILNTRAA